MFDQLKPLMKNGERYVVVEGGRPEYVLMRFRDYADLASSRKDNPGHAARPGEWERANAELEEIGAAEPAMRAEFVPDLPATSPNPTTIRLEDLPL